MFTHFTSGYNSVIDRGFCGGIVLYIPMPKFKKRKAIPHQGIVKKTVEHVFNLPVNQKRKHLTEKQKEYIRQIAIGKTPDVAKTNAGYGATVQPAQIEKSKDVRETMVQIFHRLGVDDDYIAKKVKAGMNAKKFFGTADNHIKVKDWDARHKYLTTAIELVGLKKPTEVKIQGLEYLAELATKSLTELKEMVGESTVIEGEIIDLPSITVGEKKKAEDQDDGQHE